MSCPACIQGWVHDECIVMIPHKLLEIERSANAELRKEIEELRLLVASLRTSLEKKEITGEGS